MHRRPYILTILAALLVSCVTGPSSSASFGQYSPEIQVLVEEAVFEVLVRKPVQDSLSYDKELDWSFIPFSIRNDEYYSIGTAFAVSPTQAASAFHVINLGYQSRIYDEYFIRDKSGKVYEIETVHQGSNERDFIVFSVKGRTFNKYFKLNPDAPSGTKVFSIGNALGEGIVIRNGLILGTMPEAEDGRWELLKSSADGNPGNSGGPLVDESGKVVGIVISLKDNILYSLPVSELPDPSNSVLFYRQRLTYGHILLHDRLNKVFEKEFSLPDTCKSLTSSITGAYRESYVEAMTELFDSAPDWRDRKNSAHLLSSLSNYSFPEVAFIDKNDTQWKLTDLKADKFDLTDDGFILLSKVSDFSFIKLRLPDGKSSTDIVNTPKEIMDLYLQGVSINRKLGSTQEYRITSFGDPVTVKDYVDIDGRRWLRADWIIEYEDRILISYIHPLPDGFAMVMTFQPTSQLHAYEWDGNKICDNVQLAYRGKISDWEKYLELNKWRPSVLADMSMNWDESGRTMTVDYRNFAIAVVPETIGLTANSTLFVSPSHYIQDGEMRFDFRKISVEKDSRGKDLVILYKNVRPDISLGTKTMENWESILQERTPFDNVPRISTKDNTGTMGKIHPMKAVSDDARYSLYIAMENPESEDVIKARFNAFAEKVVIKE